MGATSETGVVVFYNTDFRLLLIHLRGENAKKAYWLSEKPEDILADLAGHMKKGKRKIRHLIVQDPDTLPVIAPAYHHFNRFRMLPDDLLAKKLTKAREFLRVAQDRIPALIPGCAVEVVETRLDDFIREAGTHQILPPQAADPAAQQWITTNFPTGVIRCEQQDHAIHCPVCWYDQFLRGWAVPNHTMALCYNCGGVFFFDNGQVLKEFAGDREEWGARGIALAAGLQRRLK